jgi:hypothetical protein
VKGAFPGGVVALEEAESPSESDDRRKAPRGAFRDNARINSPHRAFPRAFQVREPSMRVHAARSSAPI